MSRAARAAPADPAPTMIKSYILFLVRLPAPVSTWEKGAERGGVFPSYPNDRYSIASSSDSAPSLPLTISSTTSSSPTWETSSTPCLRPPLSTITRSPIARDVRHALGDQYDGNGLHPARPLIRRNSVLASRTPSAAVGSSISRNFGVKGNRFGGGHHLALTAGHPFNLQSGGTDIYFQPLEQRGLTRRTGCERSGSGDSECPSSRSRASVSMTCGSCRRKMA